MISFSGVRQKPLRCIDRLPYFVQSHPSGSLLTLTAVGLKGASRPSIEHQTSDMKSDTGQIRRGEHRRVRGPSISEVKFEAIKERKIQKPGGIGVAAMTEGKIMNLSVEAKVAIAVATSFVLLIVGAMAQG